jgi:hypothetical protein
MVAAYFCIGYYGVQYGLIDVRACASVGCLADRCETHAPFGAWFIHLAGRPIAIHLVDETAASYRREYAHAPSGRWQRVREPPVDLGNGFGRGRPVCLELGVGLLGPQCPPPRVVEVLPIRGQSASTKHSTPWTGTSTSSGPRTTSWSTQTLATSTSRTRR